jgi:diguanylate cyclase (GGDEF)-like protein
MNDLAVFLAQTKLFSFLSMEEIREVASRLSRIEAEADTVLFSEGDAGQELLIILSGEVESHVRLANRNRRIVARFSSGDFFGEMAMFEDAPRSATCATRTTTVLYKLEKKSFFSLIESHPVIANRIMLSMLSEISDRLHEKSSFLTEMVTWGETARRRSITDETTGIYNRRFFDESLRETMAASGNTGMPFSLIMIDIDHFRRVDASLPDAKVNVVLREITAIMGKNLGQGEILARYGGDEFAILVPGRKSDQALDLAENLASAVRGIDCLSLTGSMDMTVTISQGIASYPDDAPDAETLVRQADRALYRAKTEGRNRALCATHGERE